MFRQPRCASSFSFTDCTDAQGCGGIWLDLMLRPGRDQTTLRGVLDVQVVGLRGAFTKSRNLAAHA